MAIQQMKIVVHISTKVTTDCKHCVYAIGGDKFAESIIHYINAHGYKLLHVGAETVRNPDGSPWRTTVAILGI